MVKTSSEIGVVIMADVYCNKKMGALTPVKFVFFGISHLFPSKQRKKTVNATFFGIVENQGGCGELLMNIWLT